MENTHNQPTDTDWKAIAMALAQLVNFAMVNLKPTGTGMLYNSQTGTTRSWREYMAEGLEMIPGITVDREAMHAFGLPKKQRDKFFAARTRKSQATDE